jgi:hypothetical protein
MGNVRKKGAPKRTLSPADEADARCLDRAVQTMIDGTLNDWNHTRPIGSLNRDDLRRLAQCAIVGWTLQRATETCQSDPISDAASVM